MLVSNITELILFCLQQMFTRLSNGKEKVSINTGLAKALQSFGNVGTEEVKTIVSQWEGKFKLSQDKKKTDIKNAREELIKANQQSIEPFLNSVFKP